MERSGEKRKKSRGEKRSPVLCAHGLMGASHDWVIMPTNDSLAFMLADAGYDVWLGNFRGNTYSRKHVTLNPDVDKEAYWWFSWDQMGKFDLPAMYDHILMKTGESSLFHVGVSMGTTTFWVAMNENPQYNDKIRGMIAAAPVASVGHMTSPMHLLAPYVDDKEWLFDLLGMYEFLPNTDLMDWFASVVCHPDDLTEPFCQSILFLMLGYNQGQIPVELLPVIMAHDPAGISSRAVIQYAQSVNSGLFCKYDYGTAGNREHYGQDTPPEYDLHKVTAPVALLWGPGDDIASPTDVMKIVSGLPNIIPGGVIRVDDPQFNHLDFGFAKDVKTLVNDIVLKLLKQM